ncbi:RZ-1c [Arabidopsis thaliana]|uniref:RZ-1c n=1 Tax=Arabidopsis thaliana TaxID=3702 RepID=A0A178UL60_ARATH|nr:RZ-1c [Arabidopsis thaliana]
MAAKEGSRIFVGGLSPEVTDRDLERAFSRFGDILDCQIDELGMILIRATWFKLRNYSVIKN